MANEKRLIDANALYEKLEQRFQRSTAWAHKAFGTALDDVVDAPTVDAVEVTHARWIDVREFCGDYMCSNCDALYGTNKFNYCPNCGAKMDGGNEDA